MTGTVLGVSYNNVLRKQKGSKLDLELTTNENE
jgi:hypothetical protein